MTSQNINDRNTARLDITGLSWSGVTYDATANHYSLLATLEDGYGASRLEGAASADAIVQIWN